MDVVPACCEGEGSVQAGEQTGGAAQAALQHNGQAPVASGHLPSEEPAGAPLPGVGLAAPIASQAATPAAKTSRLTPAAEQQLTAYFSLQDTLTRADVSMLASRVRTHRPCCAQKTCRCDGRRTSQLVAVTLPFGAAFRMCVVESRAHGIGFAASSHHGDLRRGTLRCAPFVYK